MDRSHLAIVIPAHNEEATIGKVVRSVVRFGIPVVVDDCSSDATARVASEAGATVVSSHTNLGYDGALGKGFETASGLDAKYVVTIDADGQHDPEIIPEVLSLLKAGNSVVIGVRPKMSRLAESVFSLVSKLLWKICDPLCGMKGYDITLYKELGHFDSYRSIGTELAIYAARKGERVAQFKCPVVSRADQPRFGGFLRANIRILRALLLAFR